MREETKTAGKDFAVVVPAEQRARTENGTTTIRRDGS
jgi:hypothetical protein